MAPPSTETRTPPRRAWRGLARWAGAALLLGCGAATLPEAQDPGPRGRLLNLPVTPPHTRLAGAPEVLHAEIELLGIQLGTLHSSVCPPTAHGSATVASRVTAAPLVKMIRHASGEAKTELAAPSQAPRASEYRFRDGDLLRNYRVDYRPGEFDYAYDNGGSAQRTGQSSVPEGASAHDLHSALVLLRTWRPRLGEQAYFYVVLGRRLWRVDVTSEGPQVIKAQGSARLTHRIDGVGVRLWRPTDATPKRFSLWLSEDADRVPLRMVGDASFGEVTMTLTDREQGNDALCAGGELTRGEAPPTAGPVPATQVGRAWSTLDAPAKGR